MIISRTPYRISFFGGGTDYPQWHSENSGAVLSTTIDKYCYLSYRFLPPFFEHKSRIVYSKTELVARVSSINHPSVRACLQFMKVREGVEIHHDGDLPARTGIGSSSSFTVGLLNCLHASKGSMVSKQQLATEAIHVEQNLLEENVGCQDQISAAFGGVNYIEVNYPEARVTAVPISDSVLCDLETRMLVVYTGKSHFSSGTHKNVIANFEAGNPATLRAFEGLDTTADMGLDALLNEDVDKYAEALNVNWAHQKALHESITTPRVNELEDRVRKEGCIGFKLNGAGAGGTAVLVCARNNVGSVVRLIENEFGEMKVYRSKIDIGRCQGLQVWSGCGS